MVSRKLGHGITRRRKMRYIEEEGRTVEEALEKALEKGGIDRADARFEVVDPGGESRPARVRLYLDSEELDLIEETIMEFLKRLGTTGTVDIKPGPKGYYVNVRTRGFDSALIGRDGRNLEAFEHLIRLMVQRKNHRIELELDVSSYKERKRRLLLNKALAVAKRVKDTGKEMRIDPLTPEERRIVREELRKDKEIRVYTIRRGRNIYLIVAPAKKR